MTENVLTNEEIDVLREIGNIGAGNATTSLAVLLDSNLRMEIPIVKVLSFDDMSDMVGGPDVVVAAVLTRFSGDITGMTLFVLEKEEACNLAGSMLHQTYDETHTFDTMDKSAITEVGNILMSSYLSSIESLTNLMLHIEPPMMCVDMAGSVLSLPIIELGKIGDKALVIDSKILDNNKPINGFLMMVTDEESYQKIFESLGIRC